MTMPWTERSARKRGVICAAVFLFACALCAAPVQAQLLDRVPGASEAGPGGGILGVMKRQSQAMRVRNFAYARIVKTPGSSLAMSCFERSMATASRLGSMFSDRPPPAGCSPDTNNGGGCLVTTPHSIRPPMSMAMFGGSEYAAGADTDGDGVYEVEPRPTPIYNSYAGVGVRQAQSGDASGGEATPSTYGYALAGTSGSALQLTLKNYTGDTLDVPGYGGVSAQGGVAPDYAGSVADNLGIGGVEVMGTDEAGAHNTGTLAGYASLLSTALVRPFSNMMTALAPAHGGVATTPAGQLGAAQEVAYEAIVDAGQAHDVNATRNTHLPALYVAVQEAWDHKAEVYDALNPNDGIVQDYYQNVVDEAADGAIWRAEASMTGRDWGGAGAGLPAGTANDCDTMQYAWNGKDVPYSATDAMALPGVQGKGVTAGMPYPTYNDLVSGTVIDSGAEFTESTFSGNSAVLEGALMDQQTLLSEPYDPVTNPGGLESWRRPPDATELPTGSALSFVTAAMP